jgi:hypothetical protein
MVVSLGVLPMSASNLDIKLVSNFLEHFFLLAELRELDVHGSSQSCSKVSRARCDITQLLIV